MTLELEIRDGLPDALRVLVRDFPREGWQTHSNFQGTVEFWMSRHLMFRELLRRMEDQAIDVRDGAGNPDRLAQMISHYGGMLVNSLHEHHHIEDAHYFPLLMARDDRISAGFDLLDADHQALDGHIAGFADAANAAIRGIQSNGEQVDTAAPFLAANGRLKGLLDRHLTDEEELVVPVILKFGEV